MHVVEIKGFVDYPEDGLLIGNGDLSVSLYHKPGHLVWRFGKSDVWDRRIDRHLDPPATTIAELTNGIAEEGWMCPPYGGEVVATRGTDNPQRMREICQPTPSEARPYPMPKPVGELSLRLPPDLNGLELTQRLFIEEGRIEVCCQWNYGTRLVLNCFVHPLYDALVVDWSYTGYEENTVGVPPSSLIYSLYRWADPTYQEFEDILTSEIGHGVYYNGQDCLPLPPPYVAERNGTSYIEQAFPSDPLFENGFKYRMTPYVMNGTAENIQMPELGEARLRLQPDNSSQSHGSVVVHIATSLSEGGIEDCFDTFKKAITSNPDQKIVEWRQESVDSAKQFWSKSSVAIGDELLENVWYETLHTQRCIYGKCRVPPGLMLPSTLVDYVRWHGDYHMNYNFQQPFWGLYTANHPELAESYYKGVDFSVEMGRIIAEKYYGCSGIFMQLTGYPIAQTDDCLGCCPMGRMVYMTGWVTHHHWWHYLYTRDRDFLEKRAYPVIRDCASFYGDFLKKGDDGLYHAFPSNVGEDGFSGKPEEYQDRAQVMQHIRYIFMIAIKAACELHVDSEFVQFLQERLDNIALDNSIDALPADIGYVREHPLNPPEFGPLQFKGENVQNTRPLRDKTHHVWAWYFGKLPLAMMALLRTGRFDPEQDFTDFRGIIEYWRKPNGLIPAMTPAWYGHTGGWTESLGVIAPLQEMLLQSWTNVIEVFAAWPRDIDASFSSLRAEGAFLVSASQSNGNIGDITILSEKGQDCLLRLPWESAVLTRVDSEDRSVVSAEEGFVTFGTSPGATYQLAKHI